MLHGEHLVFACYVEGVRHLNNLTSAEKVPCGICSW